jgi:chromosome segregation ATPase
MGLFRRRSTDDPLAPLMAQLVELDERLAAEQAENGALAQRLAVLERRTAMERDSVQARLAEVSTAVAHQLGELSGDLAQLEAFHGTRLHELETLAGKIDPDDLVSGDQLDELRQRQVALANELARYEIALRHDLAAAVERCGPRPSR